MRVLDVMQAGPVIPVLVFDDVVQAIPVARALVAGGIRVLEVTLRTPAGLAAIRAIRESVPEAFVGAGTLTEPEQFAQALDAGACFGVSPGLTAPLVEASKESGLPLLPGVMTPSEIIAARHAGFFELKLFPAAQAGGVGMLKALSGPLPDVRFCPTGGVNADNLAEFLRLPNVPCVGGTWLTPKDVVAKGEWAAITRLAAQACDIAK